MIEASLYYRDASLCLDVTAISVTEKRIRSRILRSSPITREVPRTANSAALAGWHRRAKRARGAERNKKNLKANIEMDIAAV